GSEMKALTPFLEQVDPHPHFKWMSDHLFDYEPTEDCLIAGIKRFPQAHWGEFKNGTLTLHSYWDTMDHLHDVPKKYEDQVEEFREIFVDACKIRMRASVPVGTALSGGIDSTSVFSTMAHVATQFPEAGISTPDWRHAVIASFPGTPLDETPYALDVTGFTGVEPDILLIDPDKGLADLPDYLYALEELYITSPVPMMQLYKRMRDLGVYVSLDGHGADELFSGYDTFIFNVFQDCGLNPWRIRDILNTYRNLVEPDQDQFLQHRTGFSDYLIQVTGDNRMRAILPHLRKELVKGFTSSRPITTELTRQEKWSRMGNLNRKLYRMFHRDNLPTLLRNYDRFSMASGVEIRMPFLDHRVVDYCFSVSWQSKIRGGFTKALLRDACEPFIPNTIYRRKSKMGFQTPIVDWLKGPWKSFFLDLVNSDDFNQSITVHPDTVRSAIESVIYSNCSVYRQGELAYASLSPFLWEKYVLGRMK
ncbi:MAG: asparagine synthetase B family protein, partial [Fidelibacterota bacterium]